MDLVADGLSRGRPSKACPHREGVIATRLQSVISPHQEAQQSVLDQSAAEGGLDREFTPIKGPVKGPLKTAGRNLSFNALIAEALP